MPSGDRSRACRRATLLAAVTAALVLAGCGSEDDPRRFPPPAEPARSPVPAKPPAGTVVRVGGRPEAVTVDPAARTVTVALGARRSVVLDADTLKIEQRTTGGAEPAAARPATVSGSGLHAVVDPQARALTLVDARTGRRVAREPAGAGPTGVTAAAQGGHLYVVDTAADGLLVFRTRPDLQLERRVALPGTPYATALDGRRRRLWVTLTATNQVLALRADAFPVPERVFPTVRQPNAVAVDERTGRVFVAGREAGALQVVDGDAGPRLDRPCTLCGFGPRR